MRILKDSRVENDYEKRRKEANIDCDICPCCGETRRAQFGSRGNETINDDGKLYGISQRKIKFISGFFKIKYMEKDNYFCHTCGAQWESDPYERESPH